MEFAMPASVNVYPVTFSVPYVINPGEYFISWFGPGSAYNGSMTDVSAIPYAHGPGYVAAVSLERTTVRRDPSDSGLLYFDALFRNAGNIGWNGFTAYLSLISYRASADASEENGYPARLFVTYNPLGDISALVTQPPGGLGGGVQLRGGEQSAVIEVPEFEASDDAETMARRLKDLRDHYRVTTDNGQVALAKRAEA
ncbi:hypothetical protein ACIGW8_20970 [Streptomyces sioyaensis]|uniref:hypothetical protein n=1 Tax=Streptomyces sioyaensis TaxID=67364 RepID=UPI0037D0CC29